MPREIRINAFDMNCVGHIQQGLWTHPRDQSARYLDIHYWTDYAKRLEAGLFDGIFLPTWWASTTCWAAAPALQCAVPCRCR